MKIEDELKGRFRNERNKALINLFFTEKQLPYSMLQLFKKHELTEPQYNILRVLRGFRFRGPSSISFLKERMLDRSSDVRRLIDKLFEKGLVDRKENAADRRQKDVVITGKGIELLARMDDCEKKADTLLQGLTDDDEVGKAREHEVCHPNFVQCGLANEREQCGSRRCGYEFRPQDIAVARPHGARLKVSRALAKQLPMVDFRGDVGL